MLDVFLEEKANRLLGVRCNARNTQEMIGVQLFRTHFVSIKTPGRCCQSRILVFNLMGIYHNILL